MDRIPPCVLNRTIQVFKFDCGLLQSHFCALNRRLNNNRFTFTFAAIAEIGQILSLASNSDTHIAKFHKRMCRMNIM